MDAMTTMQHAEAFARANLSSCAQELVELDRTGTLPDGRIRELLRICTGVDARLALKVARGLVSQLALEAAARGPVVHVRRQDELDAAQAISPRMQALIDGVSGNRLGLSLTDLKYRNDHGGEPLGGLTLLWDHTRLLGLSMTVRDDHNFSHGVFVALDGPHKGIN
ncbi:hypothetical protein [Alcanivorax sp. 1008]|uniref:hypothetical protein n=1 Tax=Alcanivorax sp. 1008 TaxID=2816853 RepID=UPI001D7E02A4|nr:hypothetical protein [Alcanivorax sp. 1008]MCC1496809.1 hypothetical protein [Alcanivorax sp. 1008]